MLRERSQGVFADHREMAEALRGVLQIGAIGQQRVAGGAPLGGQHGEIAIDQDRVARCRRPFVDRAHQPARAIASAAIMRA